MEAPRCLVCGTKHWSRQPSPAMDREARLEHARDVLRQAEATPVRQEPVRQSEPAVRQAAREKSNIEPLLNSPPAAKPICETICATTCASAEPRPKPHKRSPQAR